MITTLQLGSILCIFASLLLDASFALTESSANSLSSGRHRGLRGLFHLIQRKEETGDIVYNDNGGENYNDTASDYYENGVELIDEILVKPKDFYSQFDRINNVTTKSDASMPPEDFDSTDFPSVAPVVDSSPAPSVQMTTGDNPLTLEPTVSPMKTLTPSRTTSSPTEDKSPMPSVPITPNPTKSPTMAPTTESWSEKVKDEQEKLKELANDRTAEVLAGILAFLGISGMLFTAYQFMEYPDGLCVSCCRLSLKVVTFLLKILCLPCRICFGRYTGYTGSDPRNRTVFVEEYTNDLELT